MTAATGRPTHATVPADLDAALLTDLTPGKKYRIETWDHAVFYIRDDAEDWVPCLPYGCSALAGRSWLLTTEPPPEDQSATIARLERRVAVLREALHQDVLKFDRMCRLGLLTEQQCSDCTRFARAALADTEEQK